jgi:transcription antitermination factor NusG
MMLKWYAVQSNPVCEAKAAKGLKEHGFSVFLPVETKWKRSTRTKKRDRVDTPLFTGYLFVGLCPGQSLYHVRQIDGVRGLVSCGMGVPAEINARFVYDLQARQLAGEFDHTPAVKCTYRPGDKAKVTLDGPYRDLIGEVLTATDAGRVELMLNAALNWKTVIDSDHLEEVLKAA